MNFKKIADTSFKVRYIRYTKYLFVFRYMRMTPNWFEHLFTLVRCWIEKRTTKTGESQESLSLSYCIGKSIVCQISLETALAIYSSLKDPYMKIPSSKEEWPHCIAAIDGKHIRRECPKMTGTYYYNYKGFYSIVLLAICHSNYCFTLFNLRHYGSNNEKT